MTNRHEYVFNNHNQMGKGRTGKGTVLCSCERRKGRFAFVLPVG